MTQFMKTYGGDKANANFDFFKWKRLHFHVIFSQKRLVRVIFNSFGHLRCPKTSFRVPEMSIASEKGKKLTPVGYRKAKMPSKTPVFKVPTGRTLFSGWRLGRNGEKRFKITRKTVFAPSSCRKRNLFGHFQQIWAPAVPKNLVSVAGNVHRI